jgi:hypothetical protein
MEEVLPPMTERSAGFEPTQVRQITVYMENRVGRLQQLVRAYEEGGGRIISLVVQGLSDLALIRLICDDPKRASQALRSAGFTFFEQELLLVELNQQEPAPIMALCGVLLSAEINILYAYPLLLPPKGPALAMLVEDPILAGQVLIRKGYRLVGQSGLGKRGA